MRIVSKLVIVAAAAASLGVSGTRAQQKAAAPSMVVYKSPT